MIHLVIVIAFIFQIRIEADDFTKDFENAYQQMRKSKAEGAKDRGKILLDQAKVMKESSKKKSTVKTGKNGVQIKPAPQKVTPASTKTSKKKKTARGTTYESAGSAASPKPAAEKKSQNPLILDSPPLPTVIRMNEKGSDPSPEPESKESPSELPSSINF